MPKITYITAAGVEYPVDVGEHQSLMEGAILNDVPGIIGLCGGICSCATCHCYPDAAFADQLSAPSEGELTMLERATERQPGSRLGCQVIVTAALDGMIVRLPEHQSTGDI